MNQLSGTRPGVDQSLRSAGFQHAPRPVRSGQRSSSWFCPAAPRLPGYFSGSSRRDHGVRGTRRGDEEEDFPLEVCEVPRHHGRRRARAVRSRAPESSEARTQSPLCGGVPTHRAGDLRVCPQPARRVRTRSPLPGPHGPGRPSGDRGEGGRPEHVGRPGAGHPHPVLRGAPRGGAGLERPARVGGGEPRARGHHPGGLPGLLPEPDDQDHADDELARDPLPERLLRHEGGRRLLRERRPPPRETPARPPEELHHGVGDPRRPAEEGPPQQVARVGGAVPGRQLPPLRVRGRVRVLRRPGREDLPGVPVREGDPAGGRVRGSVSAGAGRAAGVLPRPADLQEPVRGPAPGLRQVRLRPAGPGQRVPAPPAAAHVAGLLQGPRPLLRAPTRSTYETHVIEML